MDAAVSWHLTMAEADSLLRSAESARDPDAAIAAATKAVTAFRTALDLAPIARMPFDWAETQIRLCVALRLLGALLDDVDLLDDAIRSGQTALSVPLLGPTLRHGAPQEGAPQVWARARAALGSVYVVLGERDGDLGTLAEAAASYAEALEGFPRAGFPRDWARMMRNRGAALAMLGEVANDPDAMIDAIGCYRAALEVYSPPATLADSGPADRAPANWATGDWALTHSNLGQALRLLAERTADPSLATQHLREAVDACEAALTVTTRDAAPEDWAMTTTNLANGLAALGERAGDTGLLRQATDAYREALGALGGPRWLRQRAIARHNLALAERRLAALESSAG